MNDLEGLVAIVTGGASGIGAATVALLAERGATVAVFDRVPPGHSGESTPFYECDITDSDVVAAAVAQVHQDLGRLDILVNNAGIGAVGDVTANPDSEWRAVLDVNLLGAVRMSRAALPYLRESPHAAIVNTCSIVATVGFPARTLYSASKGAIAALTLAMAADHISEGHGIRVNAVLPGTADTPWVSRLLATSSDADDAAEALRRRQPMGRLVTADEIAFAIAYLASPLASSTTGTLLPVDGGIGGLQIAADR